MELTREHFRPKSLELMDQVALLIFISEQVLGLARTYKNNGDLGEATPEVIKILEFSKAVSVELIGAVFHTNKNHRIRLRAAYDIARSGIELAIQSAEQLSRMEIKDTDGRGNVMSKAVLPNLIKLQRHWAK